MIPRCYLPDISVRIFPEKPLRAKYKGFYVLVRRRKINSEKFKYRVSTNADVESDGKVAKLPTKNIKIKDFFDLHPLYAVCKNSRSQNI